MSPSAEITLCNADLNALSALVIIEKIKTFLTIPPSFLPKPSTFFPTLLTILGTGFRFLEMEPEFLEIALPTEPTFFTNEANFPPNDFVAVDTFSDIDVPALPASLSLADNSAILCFRIFTFPCALSAFFVKVSNCEVSLPIVNFLPSSLSLHISASADSSFFSTTSISYPIC